MTLSEVLKNLEAEGLHATPAQVDYAIRTRRVPEVEFDGAGNRQFTAEHLYAIRQYLGSPRHRGRPPRREAGDVGRLVPIL